ncbi:MAG: septation regulator SpoVG [Bacilli bacterium]|nr:septation regulator SpoVG [Bacilli bacterium]MBQ3307582.1 septation regulator SpoVG [Bacilli bacterium]MBQ3422570.1 septation regulator SpoVG [Romboutsia sp.]
MQITDVKLRKIENGGRKKAVASITIDNEFVVHDINVIEGQNGLFISMPSKRLQNGEFKDISHPITAESRTKIQNAVLKEYDLAE